MAVTPIGTDTITSISRRYIMQEVVDQTYRSNVLFYRLDRANKKSVDGGTQIEIPLLYSRISSAGNYRGFDLLDTTPQDILKNAAFEWKQKYVTVAVDGRTLSVNDSPESIANLITVYFEAARMEMEERLGSGLHSDAVTDDDEIDGIRGAVDNGSVAASYGGLSNRTTTNSFWQPNAGALDTTTTTLTYDALQSVFGAATDGARHPTIGITTQAIYNSFWSLSQPQQRFPVEPMGQDEQLAKAGFTNLLFNNVPIAVDSHTTASHLYFLNEDFIQIKVHKNRDIILEDFQQPVNQDAMVAKMLWMGNLCFSNTRLHGKLNALTS